MSSSQTPESTIVDPKRKRADRACDHCREKRLKCVYISDRGACDNCLRHGKDCGKNKPPPVDERPRAKRVRRKGVGRAIPRSEPDRQQNAQGSEPRYLGSTSLSALVSSAWRLLGQPDGRELATFDNNYSHFREGSAWADEIVLVARDDVDKGHVTPVREIASEGFELSMSGETLAESVATQGALVSLMHSFVKKTLPICPILSLSEVCSLEPGFELAFSGRDLGPPPPTPFPRTIGKLAVCTLASLSRDVPRHMHRSLLHALGRRLGSFDGFRLMQRSCLANVQILLLLSLSAELHSTLTDEGGSLSWLRTGVALRMAQDIGLHRDVATYHVPQHQVNRRRRIWGACVIADRWYALSFGQPMTINLFDSDARGPSIYGDAMVDYTRQREKPFEVHAEITKLSILLGRVLRYAYSPQYLDLMTNSTLYGLREDFDSWRADLPESLQYRPGEEDPAPGLIHLISTCAEFMFIRAFQQRRRPVPSRLTFRPTDEDISRVVMQAGQAIEWLEAHGAYYLDTWFVVMYSATWAVFVQLQHFVSTRQPEALRYMHAANRAFTAWAEIAHEAGPQALRMKVATLISSLTSAAQRSHDSASLSEVLATDTLPAVPAPRVLEPLLTAPAALPSAALGPFAGQVNADNPLSGGTLNPALDLQSLDDFLRDDLQWTFEPMTFDDLQMPIFGQPTDGNWLPE